MTRATRYYALNVGLGALYAAGVVLDTGSEALVPMLVVVAFGVCVLRGLSRGYRLAWRYVSRFVGTSAGLCAFTGFCGLLIGIGEAEAAGVMVALGVLLLAGLKGRLVWLLCRPEARRWFGLICPRCGTDRVGPADLLFDRCGCNSCCYQWDPAAERRF